MEQRRGEVEGREKRSSCLAAIKESVCLRVKAVKVTRDRRHHRSMYAIHLLPCVLYSRRVACQASPIGVTFSKYHWRGVRTGTRCRITCDTIFLTFTSLSPSLSLWLQLVALLSGIKSYPPQVFNLYKPRISFLR